MIKATLVGDDKLKAWLKGRYPLIEQGLQTSMAKLVIKLARKIKEEKLSGQVLRNRTGTLRRSISPRVEQSPGVIMGEVSTNVVYAAIHEFGGHTEPHEIVPKHAQALHFLVGGRDVFAKRVQHPGSRMPERSFMRTSLEEMAGEIRTEFEDVITKVVMQR